MTGRVLRRWIGGCVVLSLALGGMTRAALAQAGDVDVVLDQFGINGAWRPGEFTAIRLALTARADSALDEATAAWVQWEVPNADGDIAEYGRPVTLTKRREGRVWLYAPLPPDAYPGSVWPVRVYAYEDGRRGRELGGVRIQPPAAGRVDIFASMLGVVGSGPAGLGQYGLVKGPRGADVATAQENTRCIFGIRPPDLPDRWEGLRCFEAIAWAGALPQDLPAPQAEALREWVRRGGHLVISLPENTNPWGLGEIGKTDLEDLLPTAAPRKDEDVAITDLMPIISKSARLTSSARDFRVGIRVFRDRHAGFDAIDNGYEPLMALPDGRIVAIQRTFGYGRITLVGLDLSNRTLVNTYPVGHRLSVPLPQADVFWARILGRRADTPTGGEITQIDADERLSWAVPDEVSVGIAGLFRQEINMSGRAGAGLLMALVLFCAYWAVAGPLGFWALKHYGQVRHAWVFFAATAGVFTALAWGGVNLLRENDISARHVTFLDHIARRPGATGAEGDPQFHRATSWMSVYMPGYGDTAIGIESAEETGGAPPQRDLLVSWTPPRSAVQRFPNTDRYVVDVSRNPDDFTLPSRSTATQLYASWLGGVDREWGGLLHEDPDDPVRVEIDPLTGNEQLRGTLLHELPGRMHDVTLIWVWSRRIPPRRYEIQDGKEQPWIPLRQSGEMLNVGRTWRVSELPGKYPLPQVTPSMDLNSNIDKRYIDKYKDGPGLPGARPSMLSDPERQDFMEMLSMYQQLTPPTYLKSPGAQNPPTVIALRLLGRELDLSPWFTRPCLIVIGYVSSECPIPLRVGGRKVRSEGTTIVRWIRPLDVIEPLAFPAER